MKRLLLIVLGVLLALPLSADTEKVSGVSQPGKLSGFAWFTGTQAVGKVAGVAGSSAYTGILTFATSGSGVCTGVGNSGATGYSASANDAFLAGIATSGSTWTYKIENISTFAGTAESYDNIICGIYDISAVSSGIAASASLPIHVTVGRFATNTASGYNDTVYIEYRNTNNIPYYWNQTNSSWSLTYTSVSSNVAIDASFQKDATNYTITVYKHSDQSTLMTATIAISSVHAIANSEYICIGDPSNNGKQIASSGSPFTFEAITQP